MPPLKSETLENILGVLGMVNAGLPSAIRLVMMLRRPDGTEVILNDADKINADNLAQAKAWIEAHPE
jgi:ABC-type methionine transport system ATPase subunit